VELLNEHMAIFGDDHNPNKSANHDSSHSAANYNSDYRTGHSSATHCGYADHIRAAANQRSCCSHHDRSLASCRIKPSIHNIDHVDRQQSASPRYPASFKQ